MSRNIVSVRPLFSLTFNQYVCDIKLIMRIRVLFGLYNNIYIPKKFQFWTKIYCVAITLFWALYFTVFSIIVLRDRMQYIIYFSTTLVKYLVIWSCSIVSEDSYISSLFTVCYLTDVTLDSSAVFAKLKKYTQLIFLGMIIIKSADLLIFVVRLWHRYARLLLYVPIYCVEIVSDLNAMNQFMALALMYSRILILRRKLERYGFKNIRNSRFGAYVYAEMYTKIMEPYQSVYPLKVTIAIDLLCNTSFIICLFVLNADVNAYTNPAMLQSVCVMASVVLKMMVYLLLKCFVLKAVAEQVDAIQMFVVTELVKYPTAAEHRAMYDFLELIDAMPARFSLFRMVDVDAALVLVVLAFCSSRVILIVQTI